MAFTVIGALRPAACEELKVCTGIKSSIEGLNLILGGSELH
jgi:hypothetical protein